MSVGPVGASVEVEVGPAAGAELLVLTASCSLLVSVESSLQAPSGPRPAARRTAARARW